ncbi:ubiquitin-conjugating enzyme E2 J1 isoform X2 [Latimeria chalumnae]|uniref:Ubiquitin-conjugating enzyme E2 J1 n=1 Tax=Latimeria chalumnae TaxID=7897 RepID=H3AND0_LATCH|nr:PREDICTED: ubiquitin-conjugating enzyme E2 J1 isoform X1 [Latimeria chalumnae]|eukprot:XP_006007150.1 PREDICTED: ubiquitin-conjugating enzyme E2 J1 isoform X1 [Latimeria chalumnae]
MESRYNLRSPAVKRLMKEAAELKDPTEHYHAQPLEDNLFEWHFTVRGPPDSEFDGGVYHGRIVLPPEYPMKPPSIILLTPNGRFEVGKKICLSISGHHPETWQPSWSIRTALLAIIGFMPTKGEGAIGSLDYTPEERKALAKRSQEFCCEGCGACMKTALHPLTAGGSSSQADKEAQQLAKQISFKAESSSTNKSPASPKTTAFQGSGRSLRETVPSPPPQEETPKITTEPQNRSDPPVTREYPPAAPSNSPVGPRQRRNQQDAQQARLPPSPSFIQVQHAAANTSHTEYTVLIVVLMLALAALIFRRIYLANEYKFDVEL